MAKFGHKLSIDAFAIVEFNGKQSELNPGTPAFRLWSFSSYVDAVAFQCRMQDENPEKRYIFKRMNVVEY